MKINTALISTADKSGLPALAAVLVKLKVCVYSTGGTAKALQAAGVEVTDVATLTGFPEMLDGRVKTLHPHVHAGILADGQNEEHLRVLAERQLPKIDLVVVNFYPFEQAAATSEEAEVIENIDIGGPAMVRAAAKNYASTVVLTDPQDYPAFIGEMEKNRGNICAEHARILAVKAFAAVAHLDAAIANYFCGGGDFPTHHFLHLHKQMDLKYGENPHQHAACYERYGKSGGFIQLQGAPLSYNNLLDAQAASELAAMMEQPAAVIVKHNNPCGAAVAKEPRQAFHMARRGDTVSAYGGVVAFNREVDGDTAQALAEHFFEVVLAPQFTSEAKQEFAARTDKLRVLLSPPAPTGDGVAIRSIGDLFLSQTPDMMDDTLPINVVTKKSPTQQQLADLTFAWRVAAVVKSNAIVIAREGATLGVGAGQMSRVDSARLACRKAAEAGLKLEDSVAASDAFFPFADGIDELIDAGVAAVIQPGGSKRDNEVIAAADKAGIAMVFTGRRHFRH